MKYLLILACSCALLVACNNSTNKKKSDNAETSAVEASAAQDAQVSPDYAGTYKGVLPAADCPGIKTTLTLNPDKTFTIHSEYLEKNVSFDEKGTYTVEENLLVLNEEGGEQSYYKVEGNHLRMLTGDKQEITGELSEMYVLNKE